MSKSRNSNHHPAVARRPVVMLIIAVLATACCLWWFLSKAVIAERLTARQRFHDTCQVVLQAGRERVLRHWFGYVEEMKAEIHGLSPAQAFAAIIDKDIADSAVIYGEDGYPSYPSIAYRESRPDRPENEGEAAAKATLTALRDALTGEQTQDAIRFATLLEAPVYQQVFDSHGRNIAADGILLFLESQADRNSDTFLEHAQILAERLRDYTTADTLPASQRRFLMHALEDLSTNERFPTLPAEDLAARLLLSKPELTSTDNERLMPSPMPGFWIAQAPAGVLILNENRIRALMQEALADGTPVGTNLPAGCAFAIAVTDTNPLTQSEDNITLPIGPPMSGWEMVVTFAPEVASRSGERSAELLLWLGAFVTLAMCLIAWIIGRSLLLESRRARLKHDLASAVSHELKTPLSSMRVLVDLLLEDQILEQSKTREYLTIIARENTRLSRLVENFLTFSRIERSQTSPTRELIDPVKLLHACDTAAKHGAASDRLELEVSDDIHPVMGDPVMLESAVMNLLDNACKYSPADCPVQLRGFNRGADVCIEVEDAGAGMDRSERRSAFRAFDRLARSEAVHPTGCGLGLYIVSTVVSDLRGRIEIDSEPGHGCTIRLILPSAERPLR